MTDKLSIRAKISLWFSMALVIIVILTYIAVLAASAQVIQKTVRDNLIETVEHNVDEVEFFYDIEGVLNEVDHYIRYKEGFLEIDDDFLNQVNQVYTSLYDSDGNLIYGENPIASDLTEHKPVDSRVSHVTVKDKRYYIFDRKLTAKGVEGLWLRGIVSEDQGRTQFSQISHMSLILLPIIVLFTIGGGYIVAGKILSPIKSITDSADQISHGNDLKKRIEIGEGQDELHRLADSFNGMFERLETAFAAEQQFTSDASHELRTPMAVITAQCELALEQDLSPAEYKEAFTVIDRQGKKMSKLIGDMLDFSRLELKTEHYEMTDVNLSELVTSLCEDMALIGENDIELTFETDENIHCKGNQNLLIRLLANLISNAYRYGKQGGKTHVSLKGTDKEIILIVKDNGIGIKPEDCDKIYERFYQADSSHSGQGTGLGLSMVKEIARFHGGEIKLTSELGIGSTFTVVLSRN